MWMEVKSRAVWDEEKNGWIVDTEYTADNFVEYGAPPLRGKHLVKAGDEGVIPLAIEATMGLIPHIYEDESVEEIS